MEKINQLVREREVTENFERELDSARKGNKEYQERLASAESREKRYEQEFLANKSEIDKLKQALQEAQLERLRISEDVQDGERRLGGAREASGLYKARAERLEEENGVLRDKLAKSVSQQGDAEKTKIKLELDAKALSEELQRHGGLMEGVRAERDELMSMLKDTTERYDKIQAELSDLRRRAQSETTDAMRAQSENDARQNELTSALRDARAEIARLEAGVEAAQAALTSERERSAALEEKLLEKTSEHSALRETSQLVMREHRDATTRIQHLTSELDSHKRMRSIAEDEAAKERSEKASLSKAVEEVHGSAQAENAQLRTSFEARLRDLQSDLGKSEGLSRTLREEQARWDSVEVM